MRVVGTRTRKDWEGGEGGCSGNKGGRRYWKWRVSVRRFCGCSATSSSRSSHEHSYMYNCGVTKACVGAHHGRSVVRTDQV